MIILHRTLRFNNHAIKSFFYLSHLAFYEYRSALNWIIRIIKISNLVYQPIGIGFTWNEKF